MENPAGAVIPAPKTAHPGTWRDYLTVARRIAATGSKITPGKVRDEWPGMNSPPPTDGQVGHWRKIFPGGTPTPSERPTAAKGVVLAMPNAEGMLTDEGFKNINGKRITTPILLDDVILPGARPFAARTLKKARVRAVTLASGQGLSLWTEGAIVSWHGRATTLFHEDRPVVAIVGEVAERKAVAAKREAATREARARQHATSWDDAYGPDRLRQLFGAALEAALDDAAVDEGESGTLELPAELRTPLVEDEEDEVGVVDVEAEAAAEQAWERAAALREARDALSKQLEQEREKRAAAFSRHEAATRAVREARMAVAPAASDAKTRPLGEPLHEYMNRSGNRILWHGFEARMSENAGAGLGAAAPAATVSTPCASTPPHPTPPCALFVSPEMTCTNAHFAPTHPALCGRFRCTCASLTDTRSRCNMPSRPRSWRRPPTTPPPVARRMGTSEPSTS